MGNTAPVAAVAMGAELIEKHLTISHDLDGPDHSASLEPNEFAAMVSDIHSTAFALGDGIKKPSESESANIPLVRRSLYAAQPIHKGELFTDRNLVAKRPGAGRSPFDYWKLLGSPASRNYKENELIDCD